MTSQVESAPEKTDGTSGKLNTDKGLADNSQLNGRIKAGQEESKHLIDDRIVQIKAGNSEIGRRIAAFIERKQGEINENNVREFCNVINCNQENSCARTDAVFTPYPGFRSHVKEEEYLLFPPPPPEGDYWLFPPPPPEGDYRQLPPPSPGGEVELPPPGEAHLSSLATEHEGEVELPLPPPPEFTGWGSGTGVAWGRQFCFVWG
ncbi:UNVERIFIED_CONTAM: hypothetical protein FKN15_078277 [Acipenser sinensis]